MNEAIKLAIEKGGYDFGGFVRADYFPHGWCNSKIGWRGDVELQRVTAKGDAGRWVKCGNWNEAIQDPLFWQALGKALGWEGYQCENCGYKHFGNIGYSECCSLWTSATTRPQWLYQALRYHELVLTGGSIEQFWKDLLNKEAA
jgi:hypothetical protein